MSIPALDGTTGYLPPGEHPGTWSELVETFGGSYGRKQLLDSLAMVLRRLHALGVTKIWIDGSFVTSKIRPRDVEVVYEVPVDQDPRTWGELAPHQRSQLKSRYKVDLWPYPSPQPVPGRPLARQTIVEFFSLDRDGEAKGLVILEGGLP